MPVEELVQQICPIPDTYELLDESRVAGSKKYLYVLDSYETFARAYAIIDNMDEYDRDSDLSTMDESTIDCLWYGPDWDIQMLGDMDSEEYTIAFSECTPDMQAQDEK